MRRAAWAGLQDSVPRAAVLALHARVDGIQPDDWEHPSLAQLWGPRFSVFVVARRDLPVSSLGTLPDDARRRGRAVDLADQLEALLDGEAPTYSWAGRALGVHPNSLRYAGATGRVRIRWDGARQPTIWTVPPPVIDALDARRELARRWLHVAGPSTPASFGVGGHPATGRPGDVRRARAGACARWHAGGRGVDPRRRHRGRSVKRRRRSRLAPAPARILPSGDPYLLAADRELLVPDDANRRELWPPGTACPVGSWSTGSRRTWRRAGGRMRVRPWRRLARRQRLAVTTEAASLPLPGLKGAIHVDWDR